MTYSSNSGWPSLPYVQPLPDTPAHLKFTQFLSNILGNETETDLAQRLFADEIDFLTQYPHLFSGQGISAARRYTDIHLTCHAYTRRTWTMEIAIEMLRVLGKDVGKWRVRDVEFEVWEGQDRDMFCRIWVENPFGPWAGSASS